MRNCTMLTIGSSYTGGLVKGYLRQLEKSDPESYTYVIDSLSLFIV